MWKDADAVVLLDRDGCVRAISRNEDEALIRYIVGNYVIEERVIESCKPAMREAFNAALVGKVTELEVAVIADNGKVYWSRVITMPAPLEETPVIIHARGLPDSWQELSQREQEVVRVLQETHMNPKRAAKQLGISLNTFNAHRRAISQKCGLKGIGEFWVFVQRCR